MDMAYWGLFGDWKATSGRYLFAHSMANKTGFSLLILSMLTLSWASAQDSTKVSAAEDYIGIYQKYIGGIRGGECPMEPSCSMYGLEAFRSKSFVGASLATTDRLVRCGHDHRHYGSTWTTRGLKLLDQPPGSAVDERRYYRSKGFSPGYTDPEHKDSTVLFISRLINEQMYEQALLEIERSQFYGGDFNVDLFINKMICLTELDQEEKVVYAYATLLPDAHKEHEEALYHLAKAHYRLANYNDAISYCELALARMADGTDAEYIRRRLQSLAALAYARSEEWLRAKDVFVERGLIGVSNGPSREEDIIRKYLSSKRKKPIIAGGLSALVPGAGFLYSGHGQTALSALILNGLLAYATYSTVQAENYGMALLTGIFSLSFYLGNISGSAKSAKRYNESERREALFELEKINDF